MISQQLSNRELESLIKDCSSVRGIKNGQILWKDRAILNEAGQPVSMEYFNSLHYQFPYYPEKVKKDKQEFDRLKRAKSKWKKSFTGLVFKGPYDKSIIKHLYAYILN